MHGQTYDFLNVQPFVSIPTNFEILTCTVNYFFGKFLNKLGSIIIKYLHLKGMTALEIMMTC